MFFATHHAHPSRTQNSELTASVRLGPNPIREWSSSHPTDTVRYIDVVILYIEQICSLIYTQRLSIQISVPWTLVHSHYGSIKKRLRRPQRLLVKSNEILHYRWYLCKGSRCMDHAESCTGGLRLSDNIDRSSFPFDFWNFKRDTGTSCFFFLLKLLYGIPPPNRLCVFKFRHERINQYVHIKNRW